MDTDTNILYAKAARAIFKILIARKRDDFSDENSMEISTYSFPMWQTAIKDFETDYFELHFPGVHTYLGSTDGSSQRRLDMNLLTMKYKSKNAETFGQVLEISTRDFFERMNSKYEFVPPMEEPFYAFKIDLQNVEGWEEYEININMGELQKHIDEEMKGIIFRSARISTGGRIPRQRRNVRSYASTELPKAITEDVMVSTPIDPEDHSTLPTEFLVSRTL